MRDRSFWLAARAEMLLDPESTNLNSGSFGPTPRVVFERATELRRQLAAEPMDFLVRRMPPLLWEARQRLAAFLGADVRRLLFTANVTTSVNVVAASLTLAAPGEILLTDHEYRAMHWCWERAAQRLGLTLRTFALPTMPSSPSEIVDALAAALTERTRLVFFSHILSPTGLILPAREMCAEARRRGVLTMIDGAHAPAMIPLDIDSLGCDFYGGNCHKWLLAPIASGFLYLGKGQEDRLHPLQVSWGWHAEKGGPDERDRFGSTPRLRRLEFEGTREPSAWLAVPTAIDFQAALGWDAIRQRMRELAAYVRQRLHGLAGLQLATPADPRMHGSMTAFRLPPHVEVQTLLKALWEQARIEVAMNERPSGNLLRVSTHFYNTEEEIDRLAEVLPSLI